ncbi:hypothetical protein DTO063F5_5915 [Paecilomyces variotii]|nr:hypothetical protein DTO063F5_5915 [Paecilomyces variotii]
MAAVERSMRPRSSGGSVDLKLAGTASVNDTARHHRSQPEDYLLREACLAQRAIAERKKKDSDTGKMSQNHALSDDQVAGELRKMTAFIRQEALEKAREIELKADEEFAIEKSKLVRQETANIDTLYEKKFKQASMSQQITRSTLANRTRLRVLSARQELLDDLFERARQKVADVSTGDESKYQEILKGLVLEGLYYLNEEKVSVRAREKDYGSVKKAIEKASEEFKEKVGKDVTVEVDEEEPLPEGSAGGVVIVSGAGNIDINNTFEERLRLLEIDALPAVRQTLFGRNENRKFFD